MGLTGRELLLIATDIYIYISQTSDCLVDLTSTMKSMLSSPLPRRGVESRVVVREVACVVWSGVGWGVVMSLICDATRSSVLCKIVVELVLVFFV